ncbi:AraC-type DNA-binding protein [Microbacterium sp. cf046]|nr:AraC family transcriptional regulator [Microbacterium sp. cf046]SFS15342.1 AraC-type DNA-binding protein [Microbacterium sp. cf046]
MLEAARLRTYEKILPQPSVHLIVNLSEPYRLFDRHGQATVVSDAFVSGVQSEYLVIESPSTIHHVGAEILPARLPMITDADPAQLAGRVQDARAVWTGIDELVAAIRRSASPDDALGVLTAFLESRRTPRPADSVVDVAVAAIQADPAQAIGDLAVRTGVSHRTLITRFRAATGLAPKAYAQIWRFHTFVTAAMNGSRAPDWAALAAASGFSDQPHVIRAFRRFTGWTPAEYYRRVVEFGPDSASFVPLEDLPIATD